MNSAIKKLIEDIFRDVECNLVMPFEGVMQTDSVEALQIQQKITNYNRDKFNELKRKYLSDEK